MLKNRMFLPGRLFGAALILLLSGLTGFAAETGPGSGTLRGCVEIAGQASYRGVVSLWPAGQGKAPDPRRAIRPPITSSPLDTNGCFSLPAAPGDYFVGAIVRSGDGGWQGPPRPGDMVFLSPDAAGRNMVASIRSGETLDIGRHASGWKYSGFTATESALIITGRLTGPDGTPRPGLLVFAFTDRDMSDEVVAVSEPSDTEGRYLLRLPEPATVYLRAREHYGRRSPADGGYMGMYGNGAPAPVTVGVDSGKQDCNLTILLVPPLNERRNQLPASPSLPKK